MRCANKATRGRAVVGGRLPRPPGVECLKRRRQRFLSGPRSLKGEACAQNDTFQDAGSGSVPGRRRSVQLQSVPAAACRTAGGEGGAWATLQEGTCVHARGAGREVCHTHSHTRSHPHMHAITHAHAHAHTVHTHIHTLTGCGKASHTSTGRPLRLPGHRPGTPPASCSLLPGSAPAVGAAATPPSVRAAPGFQDTCWPGEWWQLPPAATAWRPQVPWPLPRWSARLGGCRQMPGLLLPTDPEA